MAFGEPQEQALDLDAAAGLQQRLQFARAQVSQAFEKHVGLMEGLPFRHFVEQFEDGALRRRHHEGPVPFAPSLAQVAAGHERIVSFFVDVQDDIVRKQPFCIVQDKPALQVQLQEPGRPLVRAVQVNLALGRRG